MVAESATEITYAVYDLPVVCCFAYSTYNDISISLLAKLLSKYTYGYVGITSYFENIMNYTQTNQKFRIYPYRDDVELEIDCIGDFDEEENDVDEWTNISKIQDKKLLESITIAINTWQNCLYPRYKFKCYYKCKFGFSCRYTLLFWFPNKVIFTLLTGLREQSSAISGIGKSSIFDPNIFRLIKTLSTKHMI